MASLVSLLIAFVYAFASAFASASAATPPPVLRGKSPAVGMVPVPTCMYSNGKCSDSGLYAFAGENATRLSAGLTANQWVIATSVFCNRLSFLSPAICAAAPQCRPVPDGSCAIKVELADIARSCFGSAVRSIATCALIDNKAACKSAPESCAWTIDNRCVSSLPYAFKYDSFRPWTCPTLVGCCPASDDMYNDVTKCAAVKAKDATACESVPGCYFGNGACTSRRFEATCSVQTTPAKCKAAAPPVYISLVLVAEVAAIPPTSFGQPGSITQCSKTRWRPEFDGSCGARV